MLELLFSFFEIFHKNKKDAPRLQLKLVVIRTADEAQTVAFYRALGLEFNYHRHGNGVFHHSATIDNTIFEIYPLLKNQLETDTSTRLGFAVTDFDSKIELLKTAVLTAPTITEFGTLAVLKDPDGRKIEVSKAL